MSQGHARSGILQVGRAIVLLIYTILMAYVIILTIAFVLRLFGANPTASFVDWIYTATARIMQPFRGMFPVEQVTSKAVFDPSLLFAIIIYDLVALLLHAVVDWLTDRIYSIRQQQAATAYGQPPAGPPMPSSGFGSPAYGSSVYGSTTYGAPGYGRPGHAEPSGYPQVAPQGQPPREQAGAPTTQGS